MDAVRDFLGIRRPPIDADRVLATVLFTDIVGSTEKLAELGDARWKELLTEHDERARAEIERAKGDFVNTTGDGLLATFDGPAQAIELIVESALPERPVVRPRDGSWFRASIWPR